MIKPRIIARLDIKNDCLIKGIHLEGLRVVGNPYNRAFKYYNDEVDELILVDAVASLYQRNHLASVIETICKNIFIPVTVGGGIRSIRDAQVLFDAGADKIAINTAAMANPSLLGELVSRFGAQAIILSIQAKQLFNNQKAWIAMTDYGRESEDILISDWLQEASNYGFGEILLTSVDYEGTGQGYDINLIQHVSKLVNSPILLSGGYGEPSHAIDAINNGAHACVIAQTLHYDKSTVKYIKSVLSKNHIEVSSSHMISPDSLIS